MLIAFLDESGDHNLKIVDKTYPVFCLTACIVDFGYYNQVMEKEINELKIEHFGTKEIILRSYDIRKQKGQFSSLININKRAAFYEELDALISKLDYKIIAAVINKEKLIDSYANPSDPYDLCFRFILERMCMYIGREENTIILRMESREGHNDKILAEDYENFRNKDNSIISAEEARKKLADLSFNQKSQNINGHQIADLVAYPIGVKVFNPERQNRAFEIIEGKLHTKRGTKQYLNYGLKVFP